MTAPSETGHEDSMIRDSDVFTFHAQRQGLHHGTIGVFVEVSDAHATLSFARLEDEREHAVVIKHVQEGDLTVWGLKYRDLADAVEANGSLSDPGWYLASPKIAEAVKKHEAQALALFED